MSYLSDPTVQYIDGTWRPGGGSWEIIDTNPYDDAPLARIPVATVDDVDQAYRAAERAQLTWAETNPYQRREVFERALRIVEDRTAELTETIIAELGGTHLKAGFELSLTKDMLREATQLALRAEGRLLPSPVDGKENRLYRKPVGVVSVISPFNFPLFLALKSVAPALALGNGVVLKPHQDAPLVGGTVIARILEEAGLPPGLLNVVVTDTAEIDDALLTHPVPSVISFTGSDTTGRHIAQVAAGQFKRSVLELGGNSALLVLDDADLDYAVDAAVFSRFAHQGQVCMAANRILVDRTLQEEFSKRFAAKVESLTVGDPSDPDTQIGPLINAKQASALSGEVQRAVDAGATALVRGTTRGTLMEPVVLSDLPEGDPLLHKELFGPVVLILPFDGEDEAVRLANDTPFGLSGAVHTADVDRGVRVAHRVDTGMIHVNDATIHDEPIVDFGGEKHSGVGRLNGEATVDAFTTVKWISIQRGRSAFPF